MNKKQKEFMNKIFKQLPSGYCGLGSHPDLYARWKNKPFKVVHIKDSQFCLVDVDE